MSSLPDDLARFLFLVPFVARRKRGVPIAELEEVLSMSRAALHQLLERVSTVGAPEGSPDELVEIYIEGDRVFVHLAQNFTAPPKFRVEELLALLYALAPLRASDLPALREDARALSRKLASLASEGAGDLAERAERQIHVLNASDDAPEILHALERAVREHLAIDVDYWVASRDELTVRTLEPIGLIQRQTAWYLVDLSGKTFKVERFRRVEITEVSFDEPVELDLLLDDARERLEVGPGRLGGHGPDGEIVFLRDEEETRRRMPIRELPPLLRWIRSFRGRAYVAAPEHARARMADECRELLARYED